MDVVAVIKKESLYFLEPEQFKLFIMSFIADDDKFRYNSTKKTSETKFSKLFHGTQNKKL